MGSHGSESPTRAVLPLLQAQGALEEGHEVEIALMGDAVILMKDTVAKATVPVGWPARSIASQLGGFRITTKEELTCARSCSQSPGACTL